MFTRAPENNRQKILLLCLLLTIVMSLLSCVAPQTRQLEFKRPADLPTTAYIDHVPFYPQKQFHCGPSTLAMVMNFYGGSFMPDELAQDVFIPGRKGSLQSEMKAAVRARGMLAYELTPELVYLLAEVAVGHPVIILQNRSIQYSPVWHYALVIGYDLDNQQLYLHSGTRQHDRVAMRVFEFTWRRANYWAMAVLPTTVLPNDRNLKHMLQAAIDLEEVAQIEAANQAYQTIIRRWQNSFVALMGTANTYLALGEAEKATSFYLRANNLKPGRGEVYNNLAYSLSAQSCYEPALTAIQCALSISPDNVGFQDSYREIRQFTTGKTLNNCPMISCLIR